MFDNSFVRFLSVAVVMFAVGYIRYGVGLARLKREGEVEEKARTAMATTAKKWSLVAAFLYMVGMVSVAGLFL